jgi:hypothetical protein
MASGDANSSPKAERLGPEPSQTVDLRATTATFTPIGDAIEAELLTRKNLGTYGSESSEPTLRPKNSADAKKFGAWTRGHEISTTVR